MTPTLTVLLAMASIGKGHVKLEQVTTGGMTASGASVRTMVTGVAPYRALKAHLMPDVVARAGKASID